MVDSHGKSHVRATYQILGINSYADLAAYCFGNPFYASSLIMHAMEHLGTPHQVYSGKLQNLPNFIRIFFAKTIVEEDSIFRFFVPSLDLLPYFLAGLPEAFELLKAKIAYNSSCFSYLINSSCIYSLEGKLYDGLHLKLEENNGYYSREPGVFSQFFRMGKHRIPEYLKFKSIRSSSCGRLPLELYKDIRYEISFVTLSEFHSKSKKLLFTAILYDFDSFKKFVNDMSSLSLLIRVLNDNSEEIENLISTHDELFRCLVKNIDDLKWFMRIFKSPVKTQEKLLKNKKILLYLISLFTWPHGFFDLFLESKDSVEECIFSNTDVLQNILCRAEGLKSLLLHFPNQDYRIVEEMLRDDKIFKKALGHGFLLKLRRFLELVPEHVDIIEAKILSSNDVFDYIVRGILDFDILFHVFPNSIARFISKLFQNSDILEFVLSRSQEDVLKRIFRYINYYQLRSLLDLIPENIKQHVIIYFDDLEDVTEPIADDHSDSSKNDFFVNSNSDSIGGSVLNIFNSPNPSGNRSKDLLNLDNADSIFSSTFTGGGDKSSEDFFDVFGLQKK